VAVFTGRATGEDRATGNVEFAVNRWFKGPHAARVVYLAAYSAGTTEPPMGGVVGIARAEVVAGDAITLVIGEPVLMVASWDTEWDALAVNFCTDAGVPLSTAEGKRALRLAIAVFGRGRPVSDLPATDTRAGGAIGHATAPPALLDWSPLLFAFAASASLILLRRRVVDRSGRP
jgi:hypothetical protein